MFYVLKNVHVNSFFFYLSKHRIVQQKVERHREMIDFVFAKIIFKCHSMFYKSEEVTFDHFKGIWILILILRRRGF